MWYNIYKHPSIVAPSIVTWLYDIVVNVQKKMERLDFLSLSNENLKKFKKILKI